MSAEDRKGTRVTFLDQTGFKSVEAVIADTVNVKRILPNIKGKPVPGNSTSVFRNPGAPAYVVQVIPNLFFFLIICVA